MNNTKRDDERNSPARSQGNTSQPGSSQQSRASESSTRAQGEGTNKDSYTPARGASRQASAPESTKDEDRWRGYDDDSFAGRDEGR